MEHESNEYHYGQQGESREKIGLSLEDDSRDFSFHGLTSCEFDRWKVIDMSKGKEFLYRHRHRGPRGKTITNVSCIQKGLLPNPFSESSCFSCYYLILPPCFLSRKYSGKRAGLNAFVALLLCLLPRSVKQSMVSARDENS